MRRRLLLGRFQAQFDQAADRFGTAGQPLCKAEIVLAGLAAFAAGAVPAAGSNPDAALATAWARHRALVDRLNMLPDAEARELSDVVWQSHEDLAEMPCEGLLGVAVKLQLVYWLIMEYGEWVTPGQRAAFDRAIATLNTLAPETVAL